MFPNAYTTNTWQRKQNVASSTFVWFAANNCFGRSSDITIVCVTPSTKQLQSMQLRSTMRLQFCLLWTILLLPALLGRCCAQVDCEERPSYINCVAEFESNDEGLMCGDSDSKVIFKHKTYTCTLYIHTHAHNTHLHCTYIIHTHVHCTCVCFMLKYSFTVAVNTERKIHNWSLWDNMHVPPQRICIM